MSLIYVVALAAVAMLLLVVMLDSIQALRAKPVWAQQIQTKERLHLVETVERREHQLPFVGVDRRQEDVVVETGEQDARFDLKRAA